MQCRNCGSQILEGVAFCQQCGTPVSAPSSSSPSLPPTVAASQPSYGNQNAYTNYNPPSETTQNPYANDAYNPYAPSQPNNAPQYPSQPQFNNAPPPPNNAALYAPPPQNNSTLYAPQQQNNAAYNMGIPNFTSPVPTKPKRKAGLISGIIIAILAIVIIGGAIIIVPKLTHTGSTATTTTSKNTAIVATPSGDTNTTSTAPSGNAIDSTAASIVKNIQMASSVDTDTAKPTHLTTTFKTYTDIYSTFEFDFTGTDVSQQKPGYAQARYYIANKLVLTDKVLKIDDSLAPDGHGYGYFTVQYYHATTTGAVELYWCRQESCSDGKLAQTTTFTVTA